MHYLIEDGDDEHQMTSYQDPGSILVRVDIVPDHEISGAYEVLEYDGSAVWIKEGMGFDYWLDSYVVFPAPGLYLIENIKGTYFPGDGWEDADEEWECDEPKEVK